MPRVATTPPKRIRHGFAGQRMFVLPRPLVAEAIRDPRGLGIVPTDAGYFPRAASHEVRRPRGAAELIVIYCTAGAGWAEVDGRSLDVAAGSVLLLRSDRPHAYGASARQPWSVHWMHLGGPAARAAAEMLAGPDVGPLVAVGHDAVLAHQFERVFDSLCQTRTAASLLPASLIAAGVLDRLMAARANAGRSDGMDDRIARAVQLMWRRVSGRVTLDELADAAGLSVSHFTASFGRHAGATPLAYFGRLQMQQAAHLLDDTALPVKAIAARLGYDDPLYFSRRFRRFHGTSPARYRAASQRSRGAVTT